MKYPLCFGSAIWWFSISFWILLSQRWRFYLVEIAWTHPCCWSWLRGFLWEWPFVEFNYFGCHSAFSGLYSVFDIKNCRDWIFGYANHIFWVFWTSFLFRKSTWVDGVIVFGFVFLLDGLDGALIFLNGGLIENLRESLGFSILLEGFVEKLILVFLVSGVGLYSKHSKNRLQFEIKVTYINIKNNWFD